MPATIVYNLRGETQEFIVLSNEYSTFISFTNKSGFTEKYTSIAQIKWILTPKWHGQFGNTKKISAQIQFKMGALSKM